jgi:hypothetical protein
MDDSAPYKVIYSRDDKEYHTSFSSEEDARSYIKNNTDNGLLVFGLYDLSTEQNLTKDELGEVAALAAKWYYEKHFDTEGNRVRQNEENRTGWRLVAISYLKYAAYVAIAMLLSWLAKKNMWIDISSIAATMFAAFFYSAGTLGYLVTWSIQSLDGDTKPEKTNTVLLVIFYLLGTVFTIFSLTIK